jgi:hypothetical protein
MHAELGAAPLRLGSCLLSFSEDGPDALACKRGGRLVTIHTRLPAGLVNLITMSLAIYDPERSIVVIDEPEKELHIEHQGRSGIDDLTTSACNLIVLAP